MLMLFAGMLVFTACNNDDEEDNTPPPAGSTVYEDLGNNLIRVKGTALGVDDQGDGNRRVTWTSDKTYLLDGLVFVNSGDTLVIQPGTVIKGQEVPTNGDESSAFIVARGGYIIADGTAANPIIFTAEADANVNDANDIQGNQRGRWGGVVILGSAVLNTATVEQSVEGIPTTETRGLFGGTTDAHNAGIFRYVSIRHCGAEIAAGNELNGLTLGGVGSGTTVEYIEITNTTDDGIEFFGGTVNVRYLAVTNVEDDAFDWDMGYRGKGQYWFVQYSTTFGDRGGELDGGTTPEDGSPYSTARVYNYWPRYYWPHHHNAR
jgi:hypothetical protein